MDEDLPSDQEVRVSLEIVFAKQEKFVDALMELYNS